MNKKLHDIVTLLMAKTDDAKTQAATKLASVLSDKTSKLVSEQFQYRKGYYGSQDVEDYEEHFPVDFYGQPATLIFKGKQEVEVAHSKGGWYDPPDSEIVEYLGYIDADVSLKIGDKVEDLIFDAKFTDLQDENRVSSYIAELLADELVIFGKKINDVNYLTTMIVNAARKMAN